MEALRIIDHNPKQRTTQYASTSDFCRIFAEDMGNLYFLSLVLTADPEKAETCFVSGLDDCATGNQVFGEWARSWARRVVIKNAIRLIAPQPAPGHRFANAAAAREAKSRAVPGLALPGMSAVLALPEYERFTFVMSALEGYSDQDCALLLGCTRENVIAARVSALQQMGRSAAATGSREEVASLERGSVDDDSRVRLATPA